MLFNLISSFSNSEKIALASCALASRALASFVFWANVRWPENVDAKESVTTCANNSRADRFVGWKWRLDFIRTAVGLDRLTGAPLSNTNCQLRIATRQSCLIFTRGYQPCWAATTREFLLSQFCSFVVFNGTALCKNASVLFVFECLCYALCVYCIWLVLYIWTVAKSDCVVCKTDYFYSFFKGTKFWWDQGH